MSRQRAKNPTRWGQSWALSAGHSGSGVSGEAPEQPGWQLNSGYYEPRFYDMEVVCPRASIDGAPSELGPLSAYSYAHEEVPYVRRFGLRGGSWPFKYEIMSGPAGATMMTELPYNPTTNTFDVDKAFGRLHWTPPAGTDGQTFTFVVGVKDQEYGRGLNPSAEVVITLAVTVENSRWIFVSPTAGSDGAGTLAAPRRFAEFNTQWGAGTFPAGYNEKLIMFRGGEYGPVNARHLVGGARPRGWMGYFGEDVRLQALALLTDGAFDDLYLADFRLDGSVPNTRTCRAIWAGGAARIAIHGVSFENMTDNSETPAVNPNDGFGNPSGIFLSSSDSRFYPSIIGCHWSGFLKRWGDPNFGLITVYGMARFLLELNTAQDCDTGAGWYIKGTTNSYLGTVRGNYAENMISPRGTLSVHNIPITDAHDPVTSRIEWCFNNVPGYFQVPDVGPGSRTGVIPALHPDHIYRNTYTALNVTTYRQQIIAHDWGKNVSTAATPTGTYWNVYGNEQVASGDLSSTRKLVGAKRTQLLGLVGAEISNGAA
jgi:hypothetical protein